MDENMGTTIEIAFGKAMRKRRLVLGMSQGQAAEAAGVSRNYWGMMERGQARNPSLGVMRDMAGALGLAIKLTFIDEGERDGEGSTGDYESG